MPVPAGVDEARGRVDQQPEPAERALPLEARHEIVGKPNALERRAEHELAGVQDERPVVLDLDELRQLVLRLLDVDVRIARVVEDAEVPVDAHVDARGLQQRLVVGIDLDPALAEEPRDRPVGEDQAPDSRPQARLAVHGHLPDAVRPAAGRSLRVISPPRAAHAAPPQAAPRRRRPRWSRSSRCVVGGGVAYAARSHDGALAARRRSASGKQAAASLQAVKPLRRREIRGVHVTMALADPRQARRVPRAAPGLNTIELDVKDENGESASSRGRSARPRASGPRGRTTSRARSRARSTRRGCT